MSLTEWLNSINRENQEQWKKLLYDQIAIDFVKTQRSFPLLRLWSDVCTKELLMAVDPNQCLKFQANLESFCSERVDVDALNAISRTIYLELCAYFLITPFRQRLEQYLKFPTKRTPGLLDDFYRRNEGNLEFQDDIFRASRKNFIPRLQNFWKPEDIQQLTKIRDSLFDNWNLNTVFELTDKSYVQSRLRYCLAIRMDMIELSVAMNILGGDQWIEVISSFLRRTASFEKLANNKVVLAFDLTDENPKDPIAKMAVVENLLKMRSMVLHYLCYKDRKRIPEGYLNCDGRGLSIPPYEAFYGSNKNNEDTFKNPLSASS